MKFDIFPHLIETAQVARQPREEEKVKQALQSSCDLLRQIVIKLDGTKCMPLAMHASS